MAIINGFEIENNVLIRYYGSDEEVSIPEGVTEIGSSEWASLKGFQKNSKIVRVKIPEGVTILRNDVFSECENLEQVELPSSLKVIENRAFMKCSKLQSIQFPDDLERIGDKAFYGCHALTELVVPDSVVEIDSFAFEECKNLTQLSVGKKTKLNKGCFAHCDGLADEQGFVIVQDILYFYNGKEKEVTLPAQVREISASVMYNAQKIKKIIVNEGVERIEANAFSYLNDLEEVILPSTLVEIGNSAFSNCIKLCSIELPDSVKAIGTYAFSYCNSLKFCRLPHKLKEIPSAMFRNCSALEAIEIPETVTQIGSEAFASCKNLQEVKLPNKIKKLDSAAFGNCEKLTSVVLPKTIKDISKYSMWELEIFSNDTLAIVEKSFENMKDIKDSVYWNGFHALCCITDTEGNLLQKAIVKRDFEILFDKNENFDWRQYDILLINNGPKVKLPAIARCLAMVYRLRYPVDLTENAKTAFLELLGKNMKKIAPYLNLIPEDGLVSMSEELGLIHAKNKKVLFPLIGIELQEESKQTKTKAAKPKTKKQKEMDNVGEKTPAQWKKEWNFKKLEDGTLCLTSYKGADTELVIPAKIGDDLVSTLGEDCISCSDYTRATAEQKLHRKTIRSVIVPEGIRYINKSAFYLCESLETVILPQSLQYIGEYAFSRCEKLKELQIPDKEITIERMAFRNCIALADSSGFVCVNHVLCDYVGNESELVVPMDVKEIAKEAFYDFKEIKRITIPASVEKIHTKAFEDYYGLRLKQTVIVGMTNSEAERFAEEKRVPFESIGVVEKKKLDDFDIKDGELREYRGTEEVVIIPDGVVKIGTHESSLGYGVSGAFQYNRTIKKVVIPSSVKVIADYAFYGCSNLIEIDFPETIEEAHRYSVFSTKWFAERLNDTIYIGKVLIQCMEECEEYRVKVGTQTIARGAFENSGETIKKIILPEGVKNLESSSLSHSLLEEIIVPSTVVNVGEDVFGYYHKPSKILGGVLQKDIALPNTFKAFYCGDPEDSAWILLYQPDKSWLKMVLTAMEKNTEQVNLVLEHVAKLLPNAMTNKTAGNRVATFMMELCAYADTKSINAIYQILKDANHSAVKKLEAHELFMQKLEDRKEDVSNLHPTEAYVVEHLKVSNVYKNVLTNIVDGVRYRDSEEVCAPRVLAFVISEYVKKHDPESCKYVSEYEAACMPYTWSKEADEVMNGLDYEQAMEAMKKLAELNTEAYWLPYARYADEKHTVELLSMMKEWGKWYQYDAAGRKNIIVSRCGLLLNDTKAAMIHFDKIGRLDVYAKMRNTDADTLRDTVLAEFGFDENREKKINLGGNTLILRIADDLSLSMYDVNADKIVKSVPKKNAEEELYIQAKEEISNLKKNIKKVVTNRRHALFAKFLNGSMQEVESWKRSYLENPVLYSVARLLVWEQDKNTFVLEDNTLKDCNGANYELTDAPICLAHPMEVSKDTMDVWRNYFTEKGLKQPFEQVWEPSYSIEEINEERYQGQELSVYRMANKDEHGIHTWGLNAYSEDYGFRLEDCQLEYEASEWRFVPGVTDDAVYKLGKFKVEKLTRISNHIIYLLDKWTITERLLKDDVSIREILSGFTVAQITEFIKLTNENNCSNCTAMLLDYKNQMFQDVDPFAEFTLDF